MVTDVLTFDDSLLVLDKGAEGDRLWVGVRTCEGVT